VNTLFENNGDQLKNLTDLKNKYDVWFWSFQSLVLRSQRCKINCRGFVPDPTGKLAALPIHVAGFQGGHLATGRGCEGIKGKRKGGREGIGTKLQRGSNVWQLSCQDPFIVH